MKTNIARIFAIAAFAILAMLPIKSNAQTFSVASDFGVNGVTTLYCEGANTFANLAQDYLFVDTAEGSITATMMTLNVTQTSKGVKYTQITGWGYWYPNDDATGVPALMTATFTQLKNGQGSVNVTVTGYYSKAVIYTSGNAGVQSSTALTMAVR